MVLFLLNIYQTGKVMETKVCSPAIQAPKSTRHWFAMVLLQSWPAVWLRQKRKLIDIEYCRLGTLYQTFCQDEKKKPTQQSVLSILGGLYQKNLLLFQLPCLVCTVHVRNVVANKPVDHSLSNLFHCSLNLCWQWILN